MKKFIFLFVLFFITTNFLYANDNAFFEGLDFYTSVKSKNTNSNKTIPTTAGYRFRSKNLDAIVTFYSPNLTQTDSKDFFGFEKKNYGIKMSTGDNNLLYKIDFYAGSLRYGKGLSRLKNPLLPSASAFKSLAFPAPGIAPALPSFGSAKNPTSVAFRFIPQTQYCFLPALQFAFSSTGNKAASIIEDIQFGNVQTLFGFSVATFEYGKESVGKSWKLKEPFYPQKKYAAADVEFATNINGTIKSSVIIGAAENPLGGIKDAFVWVQANESISFKGLKLNASYFETKDKEALLPTGKKITTKRQLQLNQQFSFKLPIGTFKTATLLQRNDKIATTKTPAHEEYSLKTSLYFSRNKNKFVLQYNLSSVPLKEKITQSAKFSFYHQFKNFYSTTSVNASFADTKKTYFFSQKITPKKSSLSSINMSSSATFVEGKYTGGKLNCGIAFKFVANKTNWNTNISISNTF